MASLANVTPGQSYPGLIKTSDNLGITGPTGLTGGFKTITDGTGTETTIQITTKGNNIKYNGGLSLNSSINFGNRPIAKFFVRNKVVYICPDTTQLNIIDYANPQSPITISQTSTGTQRSVVIQGNYAYLAGNSIWDISDLKNPFFVASLAASNHHIVDGNILISGDGYAMKIYDISTPATPVLKWTGPIASPIGFNQTKKYFIAANQTNGSLDFWDIANPANARLVANLPITSYYVDVIGNYIYGVYGTTFYVAYMGDPTRPYIVKTMTMPVTSGGSGGTLIAKGNTVFYTSNDTAQVCAVDITDRNNPVFLTSFSTAGGSPRQIFVEGSYLYVACRNIPYILEIFYIGGLYSTSIEAGTVKTTSLMVDKDIIAGYTVTSENMTAEIINANKDVTAARNITAGAQIGVGTTVPNSLAMVEINSSNRAFLLPRLTTPQGGALTKITTFGTPTGGTGYVNGTYYSVPLNGGTGAGAQAQITVTNSTVSAISLANGGYGYVPGNVLTVSNSQLSSTSSIFALTGLSGGAGYTDGTYYAVALTGVTGSGVNATANITVTGGAVTNVTVANAGVGYPVGGVLTASNTTLGTGGSGFLVAVGSIGATGSGFSVQVTGVDTTAGLTFYNTTSNTVDVYTGITGGWNKFGNQTFIKTPATGPSTYQFITQNGNGATGIAISDDLKVLFTGPLRITNMPTSSAGLPSGTIWSDPAASYTLKMVP